MRKALLLFPLLLAACAPPATTMTVSTLVPPPRPYLVYCQSYQASDPNCPVPWTQKLWDQIVTINRAVNAEIQYKPDEGDVWTLDQPVGDCDDYVATKLERLMKAGVPRESMRRATAWTEDGTFHLVLVVNTSQGTFVLDKLS